MAHSPALSSPSSGRSKLSPDQAESRLRMRGAWLLLLAATAFLLGLAWDIQWHGDVGPDTFFTAPHSLMYGGTALAGLAALWNVLATTRRLRAGTPGVSNENTTGFIFGARAPKGALLAGFGALGFLCFGVFDLFWHTLYGFDITLFSPPHFGLLFSATAVMLGVVYSFAAEVNRQQVRGEMGVSGAHIGLFLGLGLFLIEAGVFLVVPLMDVRYMGPFLSWPIVLSFFAPTVLFMAASFDRRFGMATLAAALFSGLRLVVAYWAPFGAALLAHIMHLPFRVDAAFKPVVATALPAYLIEMGLVIDLGLWWARRAKVRYRIAVPLTAIVAGIGYFFTDTRWTTWTNELALHKVGLAKVQAIFAVDSAHWLPTLLLIGPLTALVALVGWQAGVVLRYHDR